MTRTPTTNPKINGQPMSFVRLGSKFYHIRDSYKESNPFVGKPQTRREVKQEARQSRLVRRDGFRAEKRAA